MPALHFDWFSHIGTAAFAFSGYLIGARKRFDLLGVLILALLTAVGGGMIRDVLVNRVPRVFLDDGPLYTIFGALLVAAVLKLHRRNSGVLYRLFIVADSIGLVAFSIAGAQVGIALGLNGFGVCFLAFVTAIGGGLVRDMMVNDVPFILHEDFYGTVSILVAALAYLLSGQGWLSPLALWLLFAGGLALRLVAHAGDFKLPRIGQ
ncbi:TRIC cation channel family protein [Chitiniphilus purpureus]|uniref:TRIC cation channel family protein n=1 Tax=Chitiniphilus purpureus TaxID=2981137 RepID=A0ABY6DHV7_9NEIS|nr:TRIC cation channel family protein [Chitiniphilus sp. CD1]UXY13934.1 TRIC cation channel family protein [Chitiniphilus sp. CD1]